MHDSKNITLYNCYCHRLELSPDEAIQKVTVAFSKPKLFRFDGFIGQWINVPLWSGEMTKWNGVEGDGRDELALFQFGYKGL